jgi:hypothetical protein
MATVKGAVIELIKNLPDDADIDEIMYHLYVKQKISRGKLQRAEGHSRDHAEVEELAKQWLE